MASKKYLIEYFTQDELAYTNRKRYKTFEYVATSSEYQYAVKLGDGASTSVKTAIDNLCNYVRISLFDENNILQFSTRWYVTSYIYHNGGQIEMFLQRDVIGENGLEGFFGKVERGYTETFLRNRKELSLNQRLIDRIPLISSDDKYGKYKIDNHVNEKWGIIYLTKPTKIDPETGDPYPYSDTPTINIPAFTPYDTGYPKIDDGTEYVYGYSNSHVNDVLIFDIKANNQGSTGGKYYRFIAQITIPSSNYTAWQVIGDESVLEEFEEPINNYIEISTDPISESGLHRLLCDIVNELLAVNDNIWREISNDIPEQDYDGACIKNPNNPSEFLKYTVSDISENINISSSDLSTKILNIINSVAFPDVSAIDHNSTPVYLSYINTLCYLYTYITLSGEAAGQLKLDLRQSLVDEPYICYIVPLYAVTIENKDDATEKYIINEESAFDVFNSVVQACSGENSYLVDAQIYPYCPELVNVAATFNIKNDPNDHDYDVVKIPFFNINSTSFIRNVSVNVNPFSDIKKEYIKRDYYLVSPEQSANTHFNFYDYYLENKNINIQIKTALKPMNIIASAVIIPDSDSLKGITYKSDLRGCQPTSNGFEVSISTNRFQEYVRNNSNYQAIFALQQEELKRQHKVEQTNETASAVMNTLSATMMGAIGGAALADVSYFGTSAKAVGAIAGAGVAGSVVGGMMGYQKKQNDELRLYEEYLQKQNFDLQIGTIKNIPNTVSRISTFNEIIMKEFYFVIEVYECSSAEGLLVDTFIEKYGYALGVFGNYENFKKNGWFLKGTLITSNLLPIQHNVAQKEIMGGIYYYE